MAIVIPLAPTANRPARYYLSQGFHAAHLALDMVGDLGQPVLAAESGNVFTSSWNGDNWGIGGGNVVGIDHYGPDGRRAKTMYSHLSGRAVSKGQGVLRGQVIGWADSTGNSTGSHLHFGVAELAGPDPANYWQYRWLNPQRYMRAHSFQNGSQGNGDLIYSLHLRSSIVVKPGVNLRSGPSTGYGIARTTTALELVAYLGSGSGQHVLGSNIWDRVWHPQAGLCWVHTNLGEWVL